MIKKTILFGLLLVILLGNNCTSSSDNDLWLSDFEKLKIELTIGYANLKDYTEKDGNKLSELNAAAIAELKQAQTSREARNAIRKFLRAFEDGHLASSMIVTNTEKEDNVEEEQDYPKNTDEASVALRKMGYSKQEPNFVIRYDSVPGYSALPTLGNPFPAFVVDAQGSKMGIIRIESFMYNAFWHASASTWMSYRETFEGACGDDCQEDFRKEIKDVLIAHLIARIEQVKLEKISALIVDVTDNRGGYEWSDVAARLFTEKTLKYPQTSFGRNDHWRKNLKEDLLILEKDLNNPQISSELKQKITKLSMLIVELIADCESDCSPTDIWEKDKVACLGLLDHPYNYELPFGIMTDPQFPLLAAKELISNASLMPFRQGVFAGPLYVVQDGWSASATEGFSSILQINDAGIIVGGESYGAGCGYTNGGIKVDLLTMDLQVQMPDCVRYRKDGKNELEGILPDLSVDLEENEFHYEKGRKVIQSILDSRMNGQ
jgi:hypothetical protein